MNYGQNDKIFGNQPFFTAGVGDSLPNQNYFESENNLDLTNQPAWNQPNLDNPRSYRTIGNRAITPPNGNAKKAEEFRHNEPESEIDYHAYTKTSPDDTAPLDPMMPPELASANLSERNTYDHHVIHIEGDRLGRATMHAINEAIEKLAQTDDVADFYSTIRGDDVTPGMTRHYLKNSYNREVA